MEFELERMQINNFDVLLSTTLHSEETTETIVSDANPDILRIVKTEGKVFIHRKETVDGHIEVSGTLQATVLYLPEGENGIRHLDVSIPFSNKVEGANIGPGCVVTATAHCGKADTRTLNPRKVLVRAEAIIDITVFSPRAETICLQIPEDTNQGVEQLVKTQEVYLTACVQEKIFPLSDDIALTSNKPNMAELLGNRVELAVGESKIIGNKLIYKGTAAVNILYRGQDDGVYCLKEELPFSQIMEVLGVSENADCDMLLTLTNSECSIPVQTGNEGGSVSVQLEISSQAIIREKRVFQVLMDAYSVHEPIVAKCVDCRLDQRSEQGIRNVPVRKMWECVENIRDVIDCCVEMIQVTQSKDTCQQTITAQADIQVLCLTEEGELVSICHTVDIPCILDLKEPCQCFCHCEKTGDSYAVTVPGGVEVRFSLNFHYCALSQRSVSIVSDIVPGEAVAKGEAHPSLVLRMLDNGECLWDIAKTYSTTIADIISANELEDESAARDRLLLIPRRR